MTDHLITPPPELVQQWVSLACEYEGNETWIDLATQAAQWGSDQELNACCEWLIGDRLSVTASRLRTARRPSPPSLKEQALAALDEEQAEMSIVNYKTIRAVLEQLDD